MDILSVVLLIALVVGLSIPLGRYCANVFMGRRSFFDWLAPLERWFFRIAGIDTTQDMDWKQSLKALLTINLVWFVWATVVLCTQGWNPILNPDHIPSMLPDQAFNTAISFMTNTNLQHYSGETGASYFSQLLVFTFLQFVSAGTGIAAMVALFRALSVKSAGKLGNFYVDMVKACTRILLPLSVVVAIILLLSGTPMTFTGASTVITPQGDTVHVAHGPVAAMVSIKQLGTNGGGFFGPNSAHPFENPTYLTNAIEFVCIILISMAMVWAFGHFVGNRKLALMIFGVMFVGYAILLVPTLISEKTGNPSLAHLGIDQSQGSMEGKEVRIGAAQSALWSITTTCTSNGSVNAMHDSFTPISGMFIMLGMQLNAFFGGVGVGFINMFVFVIMAVFIAGLMVGRTPEFLGKKIEAKEVKIAVIIALMHPLLILAGTALSSHVWTTTAHPAKTLGWLLNPGYHGFSEMLYEFTSASANNGSGFEGLGDSPSVFWNISCGIVMLLGRFIPIIGPIAIGGAFASKRTVPESAGTLHAHSFTFGVVLLTVIAILGALLFFPALALGPIAESLSSLK
ncbi:MAG: potassium-transporting ATPase subunit KdpA [Bacteroidetes bacterium]|nr:potassium-transporting ATPase subunit KdpA [Bacteroidota bacterium]